MLAGEASASLIPLLSALAPLLSPPTRADAPAELLEWSKRTEQLATITLMAAMHAEKEYCQLHSYPAIARTSHAHQRHEGLTTTLLNYARSAQLGYGSPGGSALGSLLITWCVVILEVATEEDVTCGLASELAIAGEGLKGIEWGIELLTTSGFRHDDPPEELSSIARQLLFDLTAGMLTQPRFRESARSTALTPAGQHPADTGWPAHSPKLILLMSAILEGRPALCRTFWSDPDFLTEGSLSSMLLNARYPLHAEALPTLLASLCADAECASNAWAFAHGLQRVSHKIPYSNNQAASACSEAAPFSLPNGIVLQSDGQTLRTEVIVNAIGLPTLPLPQSAIGVPIAADEDASPSAHALLPLAKRWWCYRLLLLLRR